MAHYLLLYIFSSNDPKATKLTGWNDERILNHLVILNDTKLVCDRNGLRPKFRRNYGRNSFGIIACFRPKMTVSAENWLFRPKFSFFIMLSSSGWFSRVPWTLYLIKEFGQISQQAIFGRKFSYGRNFGFGRISAFSTYFFQLRCFGKKSLSVTHYFFFSC